MVNRAGGGGDGYNGDGGGNGGDGGGERGGGGARKAGRGGGGGGLPRKPPEEQSVAEWVGNVDGDAAADTGDTYTYTAGFSAGGHLAARMGCTDAPLDADVAERVTRVVPISGLTDLRPLMTTKMNETLGLTREEARAESPVLLDPRRVDLVAWVGDGERPQLRRQTRILALMWEGLARSIRHVEAADRHHFDVIADLADENAALTMALAP